MVRAVVSTNALELGVDIGALDVAVLAGYPGTIAATWQRAGRAGRRASRSAAVLVASSAPLDQFIIRNPSYFFDASPERALIDPDNLHILVDHIKCAAFELPFSTLERFGKHDLQEVLGVLAEQGLVHRMPSSPGTRPRFEAKRWGVVAIRWRGYARQRRRCAVGLDERIVPGGCRQPALDFIRQHRRGGHHARNPDYWRN